MVNLKNEAIIFELSLEWFMDDHTKDCKKIPHILVSIICHWNHLII
jgi:hypothetical protein